MFQNFGPDQAGAYKIVAENSIGETSHIFNLKLIPAPKPEAKIMAQVKPEAETDELMIVEALKDLTVNDGKKNRMQNIFQNNKYQYSQS